ncbi:MAG: cobalt-precorrin 5A hydrolase [Clostridiales bacterium]|nr:cobalt-precorrin 5A hydrolase [Clostridiales bacterium]
MKAAIISFTEHGAELAAKLVQELGERQISCEAWIRKKDSCLSGETARLVRRLEAPLSRWTNDQFPRKDALVFIGAAGIAVRSIAPHVKSKKTDPAVIVVDERGRHAISLLSGHIGGANAMTRLIAQVLGAEPVITTATDLSGRFAVDEFAARRGWYMDSMEYAREIAAELVAGRKAGMRSAFPVLGTVPEELDTEGVQSVGFAVDVWDSRPFPRTLHLVPKAVVLGVGCRKGTSAEHILRVVEQALKKHGLFRESIREIASIDLKKEEAGILSLAQRWQIPFITYTAQELQEAESEDGFTESEFVRAVAGVGNVCERAALLGAGARRLLIPKTACEGVTVAAALADYTVCMEE